MPGGPETLPPSVALALPMILTLCYGCNLSVYEEPKRFPSVLQGLLRHFRVARQRRYTLVPTQGFGGRPHTVRVPMGGLKTNSALHPQLIPPAPNIPREA